MAEINGRSEKTAWPDGNQYSFGGFGFSLLVQMLMHHSGALGHHRQIRSSVDLPVYCWWALENIITARASYSFSYWYLK